MRFARVPDMGRGLPWAILACSGLTLLAFAQKKDETQTLQLPRDLPLAVEGDPRHLAFHVTPLSGKGLLTKQVRDSLSALMHDAKGDPILKIRAFVAGSGDARRVRDVVSEVFTDHKQALPALSLVQSGGLPMESAQVVLEGIVEARKELNPEGLVFVSAQSETADDPLSSVAPLAAKSLAAMTRALHTAGSEAVDVVRVSCFLSSLDGLAATEQAVRGQFREAAADFVRTQRSPLHALAACEAVARLRRNIGSRLVLMNQEGVTPDAGSSEMALVASPRVVLTGTQVSFGFEGKDARLAFQRMEKALDAAGVTWRDVAFAHFYPLANPIAAQVRQVRGEFFDSQKPPATSMLLFEGLPSMDAGFAMDVVAVK